MSERSRSRGNVCRLDKLEYYSDYFTFRMFSIALDVRIKTSVFLIHPQKWQIMKKGSIKELE